MFVVVSAENYSTAISYYENEGYKIESCERIGGDIVITLTR